MGKASTGATGWIGRHPVAAYLGIAYLWTWGLALPLLAGRRGWVPWQLPEAWEAVTAFGPFIAALAVVAASGGGAAARGWLAGLLRRPAQAGWAWLALLSPVVLLGLAVLVLRLVSGAWPDLTVLASGKLASLAGVLHLLIVAGLVQGLGEEPGWRGFLLPALRGARGPLAATLLLFPAWLLWHLPAFLGRPEFGPPQFVAFAAGVLSAAVWLTFVMEKTGSVLLAVAWHALINVVRGVALAVSTPLFLALSTLILVGALALAAAWLVAGRRGAAGRGD
jgi:membrane protease YdiL (CAAX protease family)